MKKNNTFESLKKRNSLGDIDLNNFTKFKEKTFVYGSNAKFWFKFNDTRILFKEYDNKLESYGEVLYSKVAKKYGVNCAEYDFATYKNSFGTISYDIAFDKDLTIIDGMTLFSRYNQDNLPEMITKRIYNLQVISMFNKKYNNYYEFSKLFNERYPDSVEVLEKELVKMFVLDVLFDHVDKNLWNVMIVSDSYGNNPHIVAIDSSHIACLYRGEEYIKEAINSLLTSNGSITIEDYLRGGVYGYDVDIKEREYNPAKDLLDFYYNCNDEERKNIFDFVRTIEIEEEIKELNKIKNIDPLVCMWINAVFNSRKNFLLKKFYHMNDNYKEEHRKRNFNLRVLKKKTVNK